MGNERQDLKRLALMLGFFTFAGPLLAIFGPPVLNRFEQWIGTQATPPTTRPAGVPPEASPLQRDFNQWMWAACREEGSLRYDCRLFSADGRLEVAGRFTGVAGYYKRQLQRAPNTGEALKYGWYYEDRGQIDLDSPLAASLRADEWIYYPARGTKAAIVEGRLGKEVPMSPEEGARFSR